MHSRGKAMLLCVCMCVCVCVCVCVSAKIVFKNASSRVARAFKDVKLNEKQPTESYWNVSVPGHKSRWLFMVSKSTMRTQNYRHTRNRYAVFGNVFITKRRVG